jgi:hypothetical protein
MKIYFDNIFFHKISLYLTSLSLPLRHFSLAENVIIVYNMFQIFFSRKFNNSVVYVLKIFLQWKILQQCKMCITFFFSRKSHNWVNKNTNLKRTFYTDTKFSAKKTFKTYLTILLHFPVKKTSFKTYFVAVTILHVWILARYETWEPLFPINRYFGWKSLQQSIDHR